MIFGFSASAILFAVLIAIPAIGYRWFGMNEVLARLRAALRRHHPEPEQPIVRTTVFELDLARKVASRDGEHVHLTPGRHQVAGHTRISEEGHRRLRADSPHDSYQVSTPLRAV